jgi:predicted lipid-binding transport protein (Tim44 family)
MEKLFSRTSRIALTAVTAVALTLATIPTADARAGKGSSSGSRGSQTHSAPPSTQTAPTAAQPMQRSVTQPSQAQPSPAGAAQAAQPSRGFGMGGMLGGLAAGFLGAGLFGMLFGDGFMSGMAGFAGFLGLMLQIGLVVVLGMLAYRWWQRRNAPPAPAHAYAGPQQGPEPDAQNPAMARSALGGFGGGSRGPEPIQIGATDYESFERLLGDVQSAYSKEDVGALRGLTTPEMAAYFEEDLDANARGGVQNRVSDVKLLQGDLAEAWREGSTDYATVAMRFALKDATVDRTTGRVVSGDLDKVQEAVEIWTFRREAGEAWVLSAIQQTQ